MPSTRSDDLLVLLSISRHRTFSAAARDLGVDHTTVARRINALSKALGGRVIVESAAGWELTPLGQSACAAAQSIEEALADLADVSGSEATPRLRGLVRLSAPEAFVLEAVAPAIAQLAELHPNLACEIISATRPTPLTGPSVDLDIGVTRPTSPRVIGRELASYQLGLFASEPYLAARPPIRTRSDLHDHTPIYYVDSMLQVTDLDLVEQFFPHRRRVLGATSVLAQATMVAAGGGIGLLPTYLAREYPTLVPVLADEGIAALTYWMTSRPANLRRPEVATVADAIAAQAHARFR